MLRMILGTANSDKTEYVYNEIAARLAAGKKTWILVPEQFSLFMEKELLQRFGLPSQVCIKVLSFSRLCNLVLSKTGPLRMKYIDGAGKQIIAAQVMQQLSGRLVALGRNIRQKGFAAVLADTISEFKRYGVSPQALRFAAENADNEKLSAKLYDLSVIYEEYNRLIEIQSADAEDNLSLICDKLRSCGFLDGHMYIMYFRSFTPTEQRAIGELMHRMDISFAIDYSRSAEFGALFYPAERTMEILKELAAAEKIEVLPPVMLNAPKADSALEYLQNSYFDRTAPSYDKECGEIHICRLQNRYREIEYAADLIIKLCRTENRRFRDFLVLTRDSESYNRIIPSIFEQRGIRAFIDNSRPAASKPLMRLIFGTLDILAHGPSYERIMNIAGTNLLTDDRDAVDLFENYILAAAPTHAMWQNGGWTYQPGGRNYDMESINQTRDILLSGADFIRGRISGIKSGGTIAEAVLAWLEGSGLDGRINSEAAKLLAEGKPELAEEYRQVWNTAISVLAQMAEIMKDTAMTYPQFAEVFENACRGIEFSMTPQTMDCVMCSSIDRFRSSGSKVVIVLGMNEGVFPKGHSAEGFISDSERIRMAELGVELAPGADSRRREEQLLVYAVLSAARERLYLFQSLENSEGKPLQGSEIIKRVTELFPKVEIYNPDEEADGLAAAEGGSALFERLSAALALYGGRTDLLPQPMRELYGWFDGSGYADSLKRLNAVICGEQPERISEETAAKLYGKPIMLSASQLEVYNSCAFKYFMTYGLYARERDKAGIEPRSTGSIQHNALYDYFTKLKENGTDPTEVSKEDCFNDIAAAVDAEARENAELLYESSAYYKYIIMRMKGIAARTAWEVIKFYRSSEFRPYGFEIKIGSDGDIPVMKVMDDTGSMIAGVKGRIDRADTAELDGARLVSVIDYKSSAKGLDVKLAEDGITIQPLLYTSILCDNIKDAVPAAMVYMPMSDPIIEESDFDRKGIEAAVNSKMHPSGWIADDEKIIAAYAANTDKKMGSFMPSGSDSVVSRTELKRRIDIANEKIRESAKGISGGLIKVNPYKAKGKHDACEYCLYGGICQYEK